MKELYWKYANETQNDFSDWIHRVQFIFNKC